MEAAAGRTSSTPSSAPILPDKTPERSRKNGVLYDFRAILGGSLAADRYLRAPPGTDLGFGYGSLVAVGLQ